LGLISSRSLAVAIAAVVSTFPGLSARGEVPTMALRAVAINDSPIEATGLVSVSPGDTVEVEIHVWGWGTEIPDGIDSVSAGVLNRPGAVSGLNGTVLPLGWDSPLDQILCNPAEGGICPSGSNCIGAGNFGICRGANHLPGLGARIDRNRLDFVFFGLETIVGTGTSRLDYNYFGVTTDSQTRLDDGGVWYVGSLTLAVSESACGSFTFYLSRCSSLTILGSREIGEIEPELLSLEINTGACPLLPTPTFPGNCDVDARRAFDSDTPEDALGWDRVTFQFDRNPAGTTVDDFLVTVLPEEAPPAIIDIQQVGVVTLILTFDRSISTEHWTCIKHLPSARVACVGSLPVDVDQSLLSVQTDIEALFPNLDRDDALPDFRCDVDRSLRCTSLDILEAVDLLNGALSLPWNDSMIETTCPSDSSAIFRNPGAEDRGACCNVTLGTCSEDVTFDDCTAQAGAWSSGAPCCAAACTASAGSCCVEATGSCMDNVGFTSCRGGGETWTADASCDAVECGLPRGACCNSALPSCANNLLESQCQRSGERWTEGATCGEILCNPG